VRNGRPVFHYNYAGEQRTTVAATEALPSGACTIAVEFTLTADGGADVRLLVDQHEVGRSRVPEAMSGNISHETLDIGSDLYTPVSEDYVAPFSFQGRILEVTVETAPLGR
jgi:arylsulfatase